jgi:DNA recombination protein RmuC
MEALLVGLGVLVGLLAGYVFANGRASKEIARLRDRSGAAERERDESAARLSAWKEAAEEHRRKEEQSRKELENAFAQLSQNALKTNSEQFLTLAAQNLKPFKDVLDRQQKATQELEGKREKAYGAVEERLKRLQQSTEVLNASNQSLATALRGDARARGRWGEVTLRKIVELAGMTNHVDFTTQETVGDGSRPDMIVKMPDGDLRIPVDSKVPMDAYMAAMEADDAAVREQMIGKHGEAMLMHVRALAKRDYAEAVGGQVTFTVMFVPGEPILAAAFEARPNLQDEALDKKILLATPVTLIALLYTVAVYWQQSSIAEDALLIRDVSREFYKRVQTFSTHIAGVGKGLDGALKSFDKAVGSYERMVLPQGQRLEKLAVPGKNQDELPELDNIGRSPRALSAGAAAEEDDAEEEAGTEAGAS